jgi:tetratricopeptide (TPR) repeat protein
METSAWLQDDDNLGFRHLDKALVLIKIEFIYFCLCIISFIISNIMSSLDTILNDNTPKEKIDAIKKALIEITSDRYDISCNEYHVVYDLLINKIMPVFTTDLPSEIYMFQARFYQLQHDYDNMMKYDLIAIEKGNVMSILALGWFFRGKYDYDNMLKYFLMGIDKGCEMCSYALGMHYYYYRDIDVAIKYYLISIARGSINALHNIGHCYYYEGDTANVIKYYVMAYDNGIISAANNLGNYYKRISDYDNMIKYYLLAINKGNFDKLPALFTYYLQTDCSAGLIIFHKLAIDEIPKADSYLSKLLYNADNDERSQFIKTICLTARELQISRKEIADLKSYVTELELLPEGPKYTEAKKHFESLSTVEMS